MGKILTAAGTLALAGLVAGCSTSVSVINHPTGAGSGSTAHVGDTLQLQTAASGKHFDVTLTQLVDPAQTTGRSSAQSGKRFIAALFRIDNTSDQTLSGDGNQDANLVGSNGQIYLPDHQTLSQCGSDTTQYQLSSGHSSTSCVAFQVSTSVHIDKVQYYPGAGSAKAYGEWLVP